MCKLDGINFGYADSEKELLETPYLFDSAFIDPKNHLDKLLYGLPFLILGRKGSGKTAYGAKIRRLAMVNPDIIAHSCFLSNLNYSLFEKFADIQSVGGRRFSNIWRYLIILEMVKTIVETCPKQENPAFNQFVSALKSNGLFPSEDIARTTKKLDTTTISFNFSNIFSAQKATEKQVVLSNIDEIGDLGLKVMGDLYFGDKNFYVIIDGLDDALRGVKFSSDIVTGLIRASDMINNDMKHSSLNFKIIVLLRSDIYALCRDPDLTKLKRDSTINLSWNKDNLQDIVIKRIQNKHPQYSSFYDFWNTFAPRRYSNKPSATFLFELTLFRPRDILQFFIECQNQFGKNETLSYSDFNATIAAYSKNYFISELQDELTGMIPDNIITAIPSIFSELGKREFLETEVATLLASRNISMSARQLLEILFSVGYIGQLRPRDGRKVFISFAHINPYDKYISRDPCILHRGLVKALNIMM